MIVNNFALKNKLFFFFWKTCIVSPKIYFIQSYFYILLKGANNFRFDHVCLSVDIFVYFTCCTYGTWPNWFPIYRSNVWGWAGGFYGLYRVPELPWRLSVKRGLCVDHQPSQQEADPHCGAWDFPPYRGRVWGRTGYEEKLYV